MTMKKKIRRHNIWRVFVPANVVINLLCEPSCLLSKNVDSETQAERDTARVALMKDLEYLALGTVNKNMCWPHIRNFASAVGLKSSTLGKPELIQRIDTLRTERFRIGHMVKDLTFGTWFLKPMRGISPEAVERGTMRLAPTPVAPFKLNTEAVLRRFMGDVYDEWMDQGTVIVKGAYEWLFIAMIQNLWS